MSVMIVAAVVLGLPGLAAAAHLGVLAAASLWYRQRSGQAGERLRFLVLIPAHNEAVVIGRCLEAIRADARAGDVLLVVADRCTDATAEIARQFGALVLERGPEEKPGRAAARQAGLEHARSLEWDAVVMLDADSVIEPGFFDACQQALAAGADAVQARSESRRGHSLAAEASLAAFALQGITIPRGRDRLGLSVRLRGTGMAIRRSLALAHEFRAPASEDLAFTLGPDPRRDALPPRRDRPPALRRREPLEHLRRPEGPLRGRPHERRPRLRSAPAQASRRSPRRSQPSRPPGSWPPRRSRSPRSQC